MEPLLNICVCSYKRPQQLLQLLQSFAEMRIPADLRLRITVVDNDTAGSAAKVVADLVDVLPIALEYCLEERAGIPFARNRAVDASLEANADYLVFVDDDEWVETGWLEQLYGFARSHSDAVICGRVRAQVPAGTPPVMAEFYERKVYRTGQRRNYCATNNVLIPIAVVRDLGLRFDETHPMAGGEDTLFFTDVTAKGVEIIYCAEAVVHEVIPAERVSVSWQSRRKYSAGTTQAVQKLACGRKRAGIILSGLAQLLGALIKVPSCFLLGKKDDSYRSWLKVCRSAGLLGGALGSRANFYKPAS